MIVQLEKRLRGYSPWTLSDQQKTEREAGVLLLVTDELEPQVVLTLRAHRLSSHAGEVALPGGKRDPEDPDLLATALREAEEEVGVHPSQVRVMGKLSQIISLHKVSVTPYVGVISNELTLRPNPGEIEAIFKAPISYLADQENMRLQEFKLRQGKTRFVPAWNYQGYEIWGLTAWVLAEFLNLGLDAGIPTRPRPERQS